MKHEHRTTSKATACPDLLDLAGWCDGTLPKEQLESMEAHLAACDHCLELTLDMHRSAAEPLQEAPLQVIARAGKITVPVRDSRRKRLWLGALAAAWVGFAVLGFQLGREQAEQRSAAALPDQVFWEELSPWTAP